MLEFAGGIIEQLPIDERMTLANMAVECGAMCGLMSVDETTRQYVKERTSEPFHEVSADLDAQYEQVYQFDLSQLEPQVAAPPSPDQVISIRRD